ncbi:hypothetical protein I6A60_39620 [Frankia sp. AgB1.9]|nr:hypothetical protein [Frankia sp. AgW1.1]MBL7553895.1 hypothetical protein [Frankia sp. AgB1.9]MBL7619642.1 hypothetical protein [Frankia sp. AgB1.8]
MTYHRIPPARVGGSVRDVRRVLKLFSPAWLLRHLLALGLIAFFIYMGHWQWTKGESSHGTLQNLFYGIEWWIFTAFVLYLWGKMIGEEIRPSQPNPAPAAAPGAEPADPAVTDLRPVTGLAGATTAVARADAPLVFAAVAVPASLTATPADDEDPEDEDLAAYNAYLANLRTRDSA